MYYGFRLFHSKTRTKIILLNSSYFEGEVVIEVDHLKTFVVTTAFLPIHRQYLAPSMREFSCKILLLAVLFFLQVYSSDAQYKDNPLKDKQWLTLGAGANTADNISWQVAGTWATRGDFFLNQLRVGYSQELIEAANDPYTFRKNRFAELAYMLGDGWGGKNWYVTGAAGFALNVRMYADSGDYAMRYVTTVAPGFPAQIDFGVMLNKNWGAGFSLVANLNFRESYYGALIGIHYRLKNK